MVEQWSAGAEENRHQMDVELVEQVRLGELSSPQPSSDMEMSAIARAMRAPFDRPLGLSSGASHQREIR
jgi:hypothetical protein